MSFDPSWRRELELGASLARRGDLEGAIAAWRRADERGSPEAAYELGMLLEQRGDLEGASAAWRRGHERASAWVDTDARLIGRGDARGHPPQPPWRQGSRGDESGSAEAAYQLGRLLEWRGDDEGAEDAWRHGAKLGHAEAAFRLGRLLELQGDVKGAEAACRHGAELGQPDAACDLGQLLYERGDVEGAEAAWRLADSYESAEAPTLPRAPGRPAGRSRVGRALA